jgi:RHS repeat-associated protein
LRLEAPVPEPKDEVLNTTRAEGRTPPAPGLAAGVKDQQAEPDPYDHGPAISLPKGGGAVRGIGEKFAVNPVTGTGSITVPLPFSPGRSGFGPQLSLAYDSGSGNGPFGLGWNLSLPAITRKTDKGLPRYQDGDESDVFILAGSEDLVPILDNAANRIKLARTVHGISYEIRLYRPRIEGLFSRIERWTDIATGISHWRTISRDNVTSLFGFNANSRIADPADQRRAFSFLIFMSFDDKGNACVYEYAAEDSAGINPAAAHEAGRTAQGRANQRYLKRIRHGNFQPWFPDWSPDGPETPLPADWHFQAVFDYGDHRLNAPTPAPDQSWPARPDPFSVHRAGFDVRTYRRCRRLLLFHDFPGEPGTGVDCLVRSVDFVYSDEVPPSDPRNPIYTFLTSIAQTGYQRNNGGYDQSSTPPLEFAYSQPQIHDEILTLAEAESRENLPEGMDGSRFRMIDLDGEGLSGILTEQNGGWGYKRNLGPTNIVTLPNGERVARARFGPLQPVSTQPVPASLAGGQQLLDLTGEGRLDLVTLAGPVPGYFARTAHEGWEPLQAFASLPQINWSEPNLQFVDLTGDGRADVLITEDDVYTFYPSRGADGFGEAERVFTPLDEERGPRVVFADGTQTVTLADMSGDGLRDIVRARNGEVCYWPNLGYGRFGARVTMDNTPRFADEERFDPRRFRWADVDGSGTTDILYIGDDGVQVFFNRSGNSWAARNRLAVFPGADTLSSLQVSDLLGNGTACLVWSSSLPGESYRPLRYVDLMGSQKPHLLVQVRNNLGAETRLQYAPSTRFYLDDQRAGRPWITRLPFPVSVVERLETYDWIGRSRFVSRYAYHHGYFDGFEREFRGFGMVEQFDTEAHRDDTLFPDVEAGNEDAASFVPPVLTRTWFHTGAFIEAGEVSQRYAQEYWVEPALRADTPANIAARESMLLPDTVLEPGLTAEEGREAYRALKGSTLRIEVYAQDGTPRAEHPYTVTEQNFSVRRVQRTGPNRHAVFITHARESLAYHYERRPDDPRVTHDLTLEVDDFGNVLRSVAAAYGRRVGYPEPEPGLSAAFRTMLAHDQTRLHIAAVQKIFTAPVNNQRPETGALFDAYRAPMDCETITAELTGISPAASRFTFDEMVGHFTTLWDGTHDVAYEDVSTPDIEGVGMPIAFARRIVSRTRILYRSDDMTTLLAPETAGFQALPGETYRLALTPGLITRIFGTRVTDSVLTEGGYRHFLGDSNWWAPSGRVFYSPVDTATAAEELAEAQAHFYRARRKVDPFGAISRVAYDAYDLLPRASTDPVGNVIMAENDYRVQKPFRVTDPNGNFSEAAFDCLGQVAGTAVRGKAGGGDSLAGFVPDLADAAIQAVRGHPLTDPGSILNNATSRIVYDLFAYFRTRDLPAPDAPMVYTLTRETHVSDLAPGQSSKFQHLFLYSDGLGREAQRKAQAEPGPVPAVGDNISPRWVGSGWTICNNKGKAVRKFEPFFSSTHLFEFNHQAGVSSVVFYDPLDRVVATLHPDNSFEKTVFDAWRQQAWDANDCVLIGDPRTDPDAGDFFLRLFGSAPGAFTSWHDLRITGAFGSTAEERSANQDAAQKAAAHAATPAAAHFDSLGRTCMAVLDNGLDAGVPRRFATRTAQDTEGKPLSLLDAQGRRVMEFCVREPFGGFGFRYVAGYDLTGEALYRNSMDGGERHTLINVAGNVFRLWDARGFVSRTLYDALQRPTHLFVGRAGLVEVLVERRIYGEKHADATRNLRGRLFRHYDSAGIARYDRYDFKGNLQESGRQLAVFTPPAVVAPFYTVAPDWSAITMVADLPSLNIGALDAATATLLVAADSFSSSSRFDALNRAIQVVTPHAAGARPSVLQPSYNEAGLLKKMDVWVRQALVPALLLDPATADQHAVTNVDYDAQGRRTQIGHGNGAVTSYSYDPETFRLAALTTVRPNPDVNARSVQALLYFYDTVGNVTRLRDNADIHNVVYFSNQRVEPSADYTYDAAYRLIRATGREHLGQLGPALQPAVQPSNADDARMQSAPNVRLLNPGDGKAMGTYTELYTYDSVGNFLTMVHQVASGGWTRHYSYAAPSRIAAAEMSNRLSATSMPGDSPISPWSAVYSYDEHGSMIGMPHLRALTWDEHDRLQSTTRQAVNSGMPEMTFYSYDGEGQRVRKITTRAAGVGVTPARKIERIYLGPVEIYREYDAAGAVVTLERETLQVMDDKRRVVMIETRTVGIDPAPPRVVRYQYGNHLESAALELDHLADVISYEEYFPYGSTACAATRNQTETAKRYRYTGKERDEENDLYYHGARYYAPWLGRWTGCDPAGLADGANVYAYVRNNPVKMNDPGGTQGEGSDEEHREPVGGYHLGGGDSFHITPGLRLNPANFWYSSISQGSGAMPTGYLDVEASLLGTYSALTGLGRPGTSSYGLQSGQLALRYSLGNGFDLGVTGAGGYTRATSPGAPDVPTGSGFGAVTAHYGWRADSLPQSLHFLGPFRPALGLYLSGGVSTQKTAGSSEVTAPTLAVTGVAGLEHADEEPATTVDLSQPPDGPVSVSSFLVLNPVFTYTGTGSLTQGPTVSSLYTGGVNVGLLQLALGDQFSLLFEGGIVYEHGAPVPGSDQGVSAVRYTGGIVGTFSYLDRGTVAQTSSVAVGVWVFHEAGSVTGTASAGSPVGPFQTTGILFGVTLGYRRPTAD